MSIFTYIPTLYLLINSLCTFITRHNKVFLAILQAHLSVSDYETVSAWLNATQHVCNLVGAVEKLL